MSTTQIWNPGSGALLEGQFRGFGGLVSGVETKDGSLWLLDGRAEAKLRGLRAKDGQYVQITFRDRSQWRASNYEVVLTD